MEKGLQKLFILLIYPKYANMSISLKSSHSVVLKNKRSCKKFFFSVCSIKDAKPITKRSKLIIRRIK